MRQLVGLTIILASFWTIGCGDTAKKKLDLFVPDEKEAIKHGKDKDILVRIQRYNFELPVKVKMSNFPEGVTLKDSVQNEIIYAKEDSEATFTLTAKDSAQPGDHTVTVTADVEGMSPVTKTFTITVNEL